MGAIRILTVCTANICRSPAAESLLQKGLAPILPAAAVVSAGTAAQPGSTACDLASALVGTEGGAKGRHRAHRLTAHDLGRADLVLALDRSHRAVAAQLHPAGRTRTFTLRQAAAAAAVVAQALRQGSLPEGAPPIPDDPAARFRWWVEELDAVRAYVSGGTPVAQGTALIDPLDVPDPHVLGYQLHPMAMDLIRDAVVDLVDSVAAATEFAVPAA